MYLRIGYGLSYTSFEYAPMQISPDSPSEADTLTVRTTVTNTGIRDAKETVQLYFNDLVSSVTTPVRQLCAFQKVFVPAGKSVPVELKVPVSAFALYNKGMELTVKPGQFELQLGASSLDIRQSEVITIGQIETHKSIDDTIDSIIVGKSISLHGVIRDMQATPVGEVTIKSLLSGVITKSQPDGTYHISTNEGDILELSRKGLQTCRFKVESATQSDITVYYKN